jgi:phosphoribosylglycinamide formyltransferase-1
VSLRVGVLGSTRGTAVKGVLDAIAAGTLDVDLRIFISDKPTAPILDRAKLYKVPSLFLDPTGLTREQYDERVSAELRKANVDLILLIGYMRILSPHFVAEWSGRLLNVHPSLLPAFAGLMNRKVHEAVLSAGVPETGCTIHIVTEEVDGGPVVLQKRCPVLPGDTVDSLKERVQALEQIAFIDVLRNWKNAERSVP